MRSVKIAATLLCIFVVVGCGSKATTTAPTGTVKGEFMTVGGPQVQVAPGRFSGAPNRPNDGTIRLTDTSTNATFSGTSGADGKFSLAVPAGTYKASGTTPRIMGPNGPSTCDALTPVTVVAGKTVAVTIACIVP